MREVNVRHIWALSRLFIGNYRHATSQKRAYCERPVVSYLNQPCVQNLVLNICIYFRQSAYLSLYEVEKKGKEKFILPKSISYDLDNKNLLQHYWSNYDEFFENWVSTLNFTLVLLEFRLVPIDQYNGSIYWIPIWAPPSYSSMKSRNNCLGNRYWLLSGALWCLQQ